MGDSQGNILDTFRKREGAVHWPAVFLSTSGVCAVLALMISGRLIIRHWVNFSCPEEQIHIVRLLLMVPIYAASCFLSLMFLDNHIYFDALREVCGPD